MTTKEALWLLTEKYDGEKSEAYFSDLKKLEEGYPLAYLIGHVPFLGATIFLDSKPLIPRTETEYWTERAIHEMSHANEPTKVLDLCAGSGCVGIAVLAQIPHATVTFAEKTSRHHSTILRSLQYNDISPARYDIRGGDLFAEVTGTHDYILANPPYIDKEANTIDRLVALHEPHDALFADEHGFALIKRILDSATQYLTPAGVLYIEHEPAHAEGLASAAHALHYHHHTHTDQYGVARFTRLTRQSA